MHTREVLDCLKDNISTLRKKQDGEMLTLKEQAALKVAFLINQDGAGKRVAKERLQQLVFPQSLITEIWRLVIMNREEFESFWSFVSYDMDHYRIKPYFREQAFDIADYLLQEVHDSS